MLIASKCYNFFMKKAPILSLSIFISLFIINCEGSNKSSTPQVNNITISNNDINRTVSYITPPDNTLSTTIKFKLANSIKESSGLIKLDNQLWTHNDSGDGAKLYQIDENSGSILKTVTINNAVNKDWEDITYDDTHVYIGDFGNNRGNRKDLKIYKISRDDLKTKNDINAEVINFSYNDQHDFSRKSDKNNNYDCEAMIVKNDKLYLFSKNWGDQQTRLYELDTTTGTHIARYKNSFNIKGLVTGASFNKEFNILLLSSYSKLLNTSIWSFSNINNSDFFKGEAKKLTLTNSIQAQIEGITFIDDHKAYLSSEAFSNKKYGISLESNLYELDF